MLRRLLAQFGLTALLMALGTGAVFADTAPAATPHNTDAGKSSVSDNTSVTIDTTHSSTTTVGTSTDNSGSSSSGKGDDSSGQTSGSTTDSATPPSSGTTSVPSALSDVLNQPAVAVVSPGHTSSTQLGAPTTSPLSDSIQTGTNSLVSSIARAAVISGLSPFAPMLASSLLPTPLVHQSAPPPPPPAPVGFLYQLHVLLISTLVPATRFAAAATNALASLPLGLTAIISVLMAVLVTLATQPVNSYTARLRRSGFIGAARSDVGSLFHSFATPREMGSIRGALAPG